LENGPYRDEIARCLWDALREAAFVPDFRPDVDDDLMKIYAMGGEEVRDDLVEPIANALELDTEHADFRSLDFSALSTPKDVAKLLLGIAHHDFDITH
jgi:hypothetical protein